MKDKKMSAATDDIRVLFARLPPELYWAIKTEALRRRLSLSQWVEEATRAHLATTADPTPDDEG